MTGRVYDLRRAEAEHEYDYMPDDEEIAQLTIESLMRKMRTDTRDGLDWLNAQARYRVLEIGCGGTYVAPVLARQGADVVGLDISRRGVTIAQKIAAQTAGGQRISFIIGDATHLPFPDACFDGVYGNGILHHLPITSARGEILRVLKPSGRAFFQEPLAHNPLLILYRRLHRQRYTPTERPLSFKSIADWAVGFAAWDHREYQLLAMPAYILGDKAPTIVVRLLEAADSLLRRGPRVVRMHFRYVLIRLTR